MKNLLLIIALLISTNSFAETKKSKQDYDLTEYKNSLEKILTERRIKNSIAKHKLIIDQFISNNFPLIKEVDSTQDSGFNRPQTDAGSRVYLHTASDDICIIDARIVKPPRNGRFRSDQETLSPRGINNLPEDYKFDKGLVDMVCYNSQGEVVVDKSDMLVEISK